MSRFTIIQESQVNDAIVSNAINSSINENILGNDALELQVKSNEFNDIDNSINEAIDVTEVLESMAVSLKDAALDIGSAKAVHTAIEHLCTRVQYTSKPLPAMESYGGTMSKAQGTKVALEFIKETAAAIWDAICAAFRKMGEWISAFWTWLTTSNKKQIDQLKEEEKKIEKFEKKVEKANKAAKENNKTTPSSSANHTTTATPDTNHPTHRPSDTHEEIMAKMDAVYDHDKKIVLSDSTYSKYLNCADVGYSMELFLDNTRHTCGMLKEIGIRLKTGKDLIQKENDSRKKLYNEINNLFTTTNDLNGIAIHPSDLKDFDADRNGKHVMFPFNKLLLTIVDDKERVSDVDHAELNRVDASLFRFSKIMTTTYKPSNEIKTHVPLNAITSEKAKKIFKYCTDTLEILDIVNHEASINKGLTAFNHALANITGHDDPATQQFAKWVQRTYQALLAIIGDIANYIKTTCHHIISWAQQSLAVREADFKKWEHNTTVII